MSNRNPEWYDLNEMRSWPLADSATQIDDKGLRLPNNLIADLNIWFPDTLGTYAFLGSVTVGPNIATITIVGDGAGFPPLAAVSVTSPIDTYRHYQLEAFYPGVAGWVVFGSALTEGVLQSYRFSTPAQSRLIPHVARKYHAAPVKHVGKLGLSSALTGIVRLQGGNDIEIVKEEREINNVIRDVAVIRLKENNSVTESAEVLEKYVGDCGTRPESRNCGGEEPIEFINSVRPDCCGNITVEFRGCTDVKFIQNEECSVAISCQFGLSEACVSQDKLPDIDGRLPNEYEDLCIAESVSIISSEGGERTWWVVSEEQDMTLRPALETDRVIQLPWREDFSSRRPEDISVILGKFDIVPDNELPLYGGYSMQSRQGTRNLAVWNKNIPTENWSTLYKRATLEFSLRNGPPGALHNGGIAFNYHNKPNKNYWCVEADFDGTFSGRKGLRLAKYTGTSSTTFAAIAVPGLSLELQHLLDVRILPSNDGKVWIMATITNNELPESPKFVYESLGPYMIDDYGPGDGKFGLSSYRSVTQFNRLTIDNIEAI